MQGNMASGFETFWNRVDKSGGPDACWPWIGGRTPTNYGYLHRRGYRGNRYRWLAHRAAWVVSNGEIPAGMCVLHLCDNPPCCNPAHLWIGAHADNVADCVSKGRNNAGKGERHNNARLTEADVIAMRTRYAAGGISHSQIARMYGVTKSCAQHAISGRTWAYLPGAVGEFERAGAATLASVFGRVPVEA